MRRILAVLFAAAVLPLLTGCTCLTGNCGTRDRAAGDADAAAAMPTEVYDRGDWSQDSVVVMGGRLVVGVAMETPGFFLHDPLWHLGQAFERDGYPYGAIRTGCNLFYIPTINACKYWNHPERLTRIDRVWETDAQLFVDDVDMFWLQNRPSYLTPYYVR
jgi:hypothetical protein